jgi:RNA polymerase sigma factor (TIGR02999 family)
MSDSIPPVQMAPRGGELTQMLQRWQDGDQDALNALLPHVYSDLRRIAAAELRGKSGHDTLQPTALVNDMFVRLLGNHAVGLNNRKHFFATAGKIMRQLLNDRARAKMRGKRGGQDWQRVEMTELAMLPVAALFSDLFTHAQQETDLLALDEALVALEKLDARMAEVVELRYFVGLEVTEVAELMAVDERTIYRDWQMARAWLRARLAETEMPL